MKRIQFIAKVFTCPVQLFFYMLLAFQRKLHRILHSAACIQQQTGTLLQSLKIAGICTLRLTGIFQISSETVKLSSKRFGLLVHKLLHDLVQTFDLTFLIAFHQFHDGLHGVRHICLID